MIKIIQKFRAWDSEANIMIYSDHRTRKLYDVYYGFEMNEKGELECRWEGDFTESHVLDGGILDNIMQYTGLKDKNGVEIYEGDILLFNNDCPKPQKADWKCVVKYREASFVCEYPKDGVYNHFDSWNVPAVTWEVVGNIYENPDLLKNADNTE